MPASKIIIEIKDGTVSRVVTSGTCEIRYIDHDLLLSGEQPDNSTYEPDEIIHSPKNMDDYIDNTINNNQIQD